MNKQSVTVLLTLVAIVSAAPPSVVGIDSLSREAIQAGMAAQGMKVEELGFFKQWAVDSFSLPH